MPLLCSTFVRIRSVLNSWYGRADRSDDLIPLPFSLHTASAETGRFISEGYIAGIVSSPAAMASEKVAMRLEVVQMWRSCGWDGDNLNDLDVFSCLSTLNVSGASRGERGFESGCLAAFTWASGGLLSKVTAAGCYCLSDVDVQSLALLSAAQLRSLQAFIKL